MPTKAPTRSQEHLHDAFKTPQRRTDAAKTARGICKTLHNDLTYFQDGSIPLPDGQAAPKTPPVRPESRPETQGIKPS